MRANNNGLAYFLFTLSTSQAIKNNGFKPVRKKLFKRLDWGSAMHCLAEIIIIQPKN
jgi:hypothetical protein